jgi:hypothetical protein
MSEFSHLSEEVPQHLIDDASRYTIVVRDGSGSVRVAGQIHPEQRIVNPFDLDLTQFIPNPPVRFEGLVKMIGDIIADAQSREGIVAKEQCKFVQEYNPDSFAEIGDELVSIKLIRREPANMSRNGKSRPNRGWTSAYEYANPEEPNKIICVDTRPIDHKIELAVWAKTATLANRRALWLERLLIGQRWMFTSKGVQPFNWLERGTDYVWTPSSVRLHQRPLQFSARLFEYTVMAYPTLREFQLDLTTDTLS